MSPVALRLAAMMFLQFFVWGAWYVTAPRYLGQIGFTGTDFGWLYSVGPIAGIISPFFVGMVADRFFPTERVLGLLHLIGGSLLFASTMLMTGEAAPPWTIILVFLGHMLCYYPTLALTNSLSMHNLDDTEKQFPLVRVFGTIGWIVAGVILGVMQWGGTVDQFRLAGGAALLLGLYSFSLPHTPPPLAGEKVTAKQALGLDAWVLLKRPSFLVFIVCSMLVCIPLAFYYQLAERSVTQAGLAEVPLDLAATTFVLTPPIIMTFGQISEILFMVLMPFFFVRLGVKWMLAVGMLAWVARYALFAVGAPADIRWMMIVGVVLHGICYDFFFVTGQIYTDKTAPAGIRSQAQGMLVLFTLGIGMLVGAQIGGRVEKFYTPVETPLYNAQAKALGARAKAIEEELPDEAVEDVEAEPGSEARGPEVTASYAELEEAVDQRLPTDLRERLRSTTDELVAAKAAGRPTEVVKPLEAAQAEALDEWVGIVSQVVDRRAEETLEEQAGSRTELALRMQLLKFYSDGKVLAALNAMNWQAIWAIPAIGAAVVLVLFVALFRDQVSDEDEESVSEEDVAEGAAREEMM